MKDKNRLTIGIMLHYLDNDYSKKLLRGAVAAAEAMDVNLVIMPGRSLNCQLHDTEHTTYEYQYNTLYSYASAENLDALIISAGTVGQFVTKEEFKQFVDSFEGLPVLTIESAVRGYPCMRLSGSGIKKMVEHLINEHGKKHIAFVSGPKGNADAEERLSYYREALEENGIPYDPDMVAYGRFSEYCVDIVGDLLDRNKGKIDAICFANDMMCKGGYKAIEARGLVIGRDIAVTGYDDSEVATTLSPFLTTIRADSTKLGADAVIEAIKLAQGKPVEQFIGLDSTVVIRNSCGCSSFWSDITAGRADFVRESSSETLADMVITEYLPNSLTRVSPVVAELKKMMTLLFQYARDPKENDPSDQHGIFGTMLANGLIEHLHPDAFIDMLKSVRYIAVTLCEGNAEKTIAIHQVIEQGYDAVTGHMLNFHSDTVNDLIYTNFLINNIAKDMAINSSDEEKCYLSIVGNICRTHMISSYLYTYAEPVVNTEDTEWHRPADLYLKSYHDGEVLTAVKPADQHINSLECITNRHTPDRRRTMIMFPLFMNEEHYGLIVSEIEFDFYCNIYSIAPQICTAIKLTRLINQLECSLDAAASRNAHLNKISMHDELTGVFNRRGFYESANRIFTAPENDGKHAVLIFADLDNLKNINDCFGHEEGDYAIVSSAGFLKNCLRSTDIVARIGGDEFAAFALCEENIAHEIPHRIKQIAENHNKTSDKKYNVTMSIGICPLTCAPSLSIQAFMDKADAALYEDKKHKNRDIMKK